MTETRAAPPPPPVTAPKRAPIGDGGPSGVLPMLGAFLVGIAGSIIFLALHLPLPWYLGSLTACLIASVAGAPIRRPKPLSVPMRIVLGVAVGTAFTPALLARGGGMALSLLLLIPWLGFIVLIGMPFYERLAGFDRPTAFYSAVPGGLADMATMAEDSGANQRAVTLVQGTRIMLIVFFVPLWLQWHDGLAPPSVFASTVRLMDMQLADAAMLVGIGIAGWWAAERLGLAGAPIVGPMILSGVLHATGMTTAKVPLEVMIIAQIGVGVLLGAQFRGLTLKEFLSTMIWGILFALLLLVLTVIVVVPVARLTGFPAASILLAYAPGGQTEMNLLTLILGLDVAFVALHHLLRLFCVIIGAQIVFKMRQDWRKPRS